MNPDTTVGLDAIDTYIGNGGYFPKQSDHREINVSQPSSIILYQNYPNPFNPRTEISFYLNEPFNIKLKVTDALGRDVSTLIDGNVEGGKHTVFFDGSQFPSGVYYYQLVSSGATLTRKMSLVK